MMLDCDTSLGPKAQFNQSAHCLAECGNRTLGLAPSVDAGKLFRGKLDLPWRTNRRAAATVFLVLHVDNLSGMAHKFSIRETCARVKKMINGSGASKPGYLYRHWSASDKLLYVGISINAVVRLGQHRGSAWFNQIAKVTLHQFEDLAAAQRAEAHAILTEAPLYNVRGCQKVSSVKKSSAEAKARERARKKTMGMVFRSVWVVPGAWENILPVIERENRRVERERKKQDD